MIYICYIIYGDYIAKCVLAVGNDELAVRDDDDASSEVAETRARVEEQSSKPAPVYQHS
jgi:hypothetical protein